jgi:hypothetical protein
MTINNNSISMQRSQQSSHQNSTSYNPVIEQGGVAGATIIILTLFMAVMMNKLTVMIKLLGSMHKTEPTIPEKRDQ